MTTSRLDENLLRPGALPEGLMARALTLGALGQSFVDWLAPQGAWAKQVRLAQMDHRTVTLTAASAATATRLRFAEPQIVDWFAKQTGKPICSMKVSVRAASGLGLNQSVGR